jgi:hypothetical protein
MIALQRQLATSGRLFAGWSIKAQRTAFEQLSLATASNRREAVKAEAVESALDQDGQQLKYCLTAAAKEGGGQVGVK